MKRKPKICNVTGCKNQAAFVVGVNLMVHPNHTPARSTPIYKVCTEHKDVKWEEVVSDNGWKQMCDAMVKAGAVRPTKKHSHLYFQPIKDLEHEIFKTI